MTLALNLFLILSVTPMKERVSDSGGVNADVNLDDKRLLNMKCCVLCILNYVDVLIWVFVIVSARVIVGACGSYYDYINVHISLKLISSNIT